MKTHSYMKSEAQDIGEKVLYYSRLKKYIDSNTTRVKMFTLIIVAVLLLTPIVLITHKQLSKITCSEIQQVQMVSLPIAATSSKTTTLTIPSGTVKANPFLPYRDIGNVAGVSEVPGYTLVEPPTVSGASSDAVRVMDTTVSGILYDKFNPSAILNIEGND